jgi:hypothetical protein
MTLEIPYISHYAGDKADAHEVQLGPITIWFSYRTPIAYQTRAGRVVRRENDWGAVTGRHLNIIDGGGPARRGRLPGEYFESLLSECLKKLDEPTSHSDARPKEYEL